MEPKIWEPVAIDKSLEQRRNLALAVVILALLLFVAIGVAVHEHSRAQEQVTIAAGEHQRAEQLSTRVAVLERQLGDTQRDAADLRSKVDAKSPISAFKRFITGARNIFSR